jgi:hypothetical protein
MGEGERYESRDKEVRKREKDVKGTRKGRKRGGVVALSHGPRSLHVDITVAIGGINLYV